MGSLLPNWAWWIAIITAIGGAIDFLLGRAGQDRTRDFLTRWWVRFDDVKWQNFGIKEAEFAINIIDTIAGNKFNSRRRGLFLCSMLVILLIISYIIQEIANPSRTFANMRMSRDFNSINMIRLAISVIGMAVSLSFTRKIATVVAYLCGKTASNNLVIFFAFIIFSYFLMIAWVPLVSGIADFVIYFILIHLIPISTYLDVIGYAIDKNLIGISFIPKSYIDSIIKNITINENIDFVRDSWLVMSDRPISRDFKEVRQFYPFGFVITFLGYSTSILRLMLAIVFLGCFLVPPVIINPLSLVWRRIIESEKPVFTLVFGGIAGTITLVLELAKHL